LQNANEPVDVRFVQGSIEFVQHAERTRLHLINREEQRNRSHCLLAARQQRDGLELLSRRTRNDVDSALQDVVFVHQNQVRFAAAKDLGEHGSKILSDLLERCSKHFTCLNVDPVDDVEQLRFGLNEVVVLFAEELVALFGLLVFFNRHKVYRAHFVQALLQN